MHYTTLFSTAFRFQKAATDNGFTILSIVQNNYQEIVKTSLESNSWLPNESKEGCLLLTRNCQEATSSLKAFVDRGFEEMGRYFDDADGEEKTKKQPSSPATSEKSSTTAVKKSATRKKPAARKTQSTPKKPAPKKAAPPAKSKTAAKKKTPAKAAQTAPAAVTVKEADSSRNT